LTIDQQGNIYLCERAVLVYNAHGDRIDEIRLPESPTNACFGGRDGRTLFVTTRGAFYAVQRRERPRQPTTVQRPATSRDEPRRPREEDRPSRGGPQPMRETRPRGLQQGPARHNHPVLIALDADGDGDITAAEIQNAVAALKSLDKDGDGWIRREEMRPANANRRPQN